MRYLERVKSVGDIAREERAEANDSGADSETATSEANNNVQVRLRGELPNSKLRRKGAELAVGALNPLQIQRRRMELSTWEKGKGTQRPSRIRLRKPYLGLAGTRRSEGSLVLERERVDSCGDCRAALGEGMKSEKRVLRHAIREEPKNKGGKPYGVRITRGKKRRLGHRLRHAGRRNTSEERASEHLGGRATNEVVWNGKGREEERMKKKGEGSIDEMHRSAYASSFPPLEVLLVTHDKTFARFFFFSPPGPLHFHGSERRWPRCRLEIGCGMKPRRTRFCPCNARSRRPKDGFSRLPLARFVFFLCFAHERCVVPFCCVLGVAYACFRCNG